MFCKICGALTGAKYKKYCLSCFKDKKRDELHELIIENEALRTENRQLKKSIALDERFIKMLKQLAHPDKHGGSKLSNEATARLNKL